jgi:arylformamidase
LDVAAAQIEEKYMKSLGSRIVDISFPLDARTYRNNLPQAIVSRYPGKAIGFEIDQLIERGGPDSVGQVARGVKMRLHAGSHIDAPEHWIPGGKQIHELPLAQFIGEVVIADLSGKTEKSITDTNLDRAVGSLLREGERLLIRTDWNDRLPRMQVDEWKKDSPFMTPAALDWCIARRPIIVGIDFYHGAAPPGAEHSQMFESRLGRAGILTLTNLVNLGAVKSRRGTLIAFPLALHGVEASPVRAVVLEDA